MQLKSNEGWKHGKKAQVDTPLWPEPRFIPRRPCCLRAAVWVFLWQLLHCAPFPANPQLGIWGPCVRPFPGIKLEENSSIETQHAGTAISTAWPQTSGYLQHGARSTCRSHSTRDHGHFTVCQAAEQKRKEKAMAV